MRSSYFPYCRLRLLPVLGAVCVFALVKAGSAAAEDCRYDGATRIVTATVTPGGSATLQVVGGELRFGLSPVPCLDEAMDSTATTSNTDTITIDGGVGSVERLVLDQRGGLFAPGASADNGAFPEIEIETALGDLEDTVVIYLTEGDDTIAAGQSGVGLNADGDADVMFSPETFSLEIHALGGIDFVNGRGGLGAGLAYLGPLTIDGGPGDDELLRGSFGADVLLGGDGDDQIQGNDGADVIDGGPGNDVLRAGGGNDEVIGGPGADTFVGVDGDDTFRAADGEADLRLNGGPGIDTAYYDPGLDPPPSFVERLVRQVSSLQLVCYTADSAWHRRNVAISCSADDPESGIPKPADRAFTLATFVPRGVETADAATGTREVCSGAGLCITAGPVGGNKVDRKTPSNPKGIRSTDHRLRHPSRDRRITVAFGAGKDAGSGVDGFSYSWTKRATSAPDRVKDREQGARRATSRRLEKGRWFFHLRTRDNVGNWSAPVHLGPFPLR